VERNDFPLDPSPSNVESKGEVPSDDDIAGYWEGKPITYAEMAAKMNAIQRGDIPMPAPRLKVMSQDDQQMLEEMGPSDLAMDYPWSPRFPCDEELRGGDIRETMFDTLPEMDIIIENECIL
jgi:hypothetical protein